MSLWHWYNTSHINKMANAIPGLTSGLDDNHPAAAILEGDALDDAHVAAACHHHKTRKRLATIYPHLVTQEELVASKHRKQMVVASTFVDVPMPAWGREMMKQMEQRMEQMERRLLHENQCSVNRARQHYTNYIEPVMRLTDGKKPTDAPFNLWFPKNENGLYYSQKNDDVVNVEGEEVNQSRDNRINSLLAFYSLSDDGTIRERIDRLKAHLAVIL